VSLDTLLERQLAIAAQADPRHCSKCGRYPERWYYGFPLPLRCFCIDVRMWGHCPRCGGTVRQEPPGSGVLTVHGPKDNPCPGSGMHPASTDQTTNGPTPTRARIRPESSRAATATRAGRTNRS
jgi:hypothetical protein